MNPGDTSKFVRRAQSKRSNQERRAFLCKFEQFSVDEPAFQCEIRLCDAHAVENHRRFSGSSKHPRASEFMSLVPAEAESSIFHSPRKAVHDHRVTATIDGVLNLTGHASQSLWRQAALEDRELDALAVLFTNLSDASETECSAVFRVGDVVSNQNVHDVRT